VIAPPLADRARTSELRRFLGEAGYTGERLQALLHSGAELLFRTTDVAVHLRRLEGETTPLAPLVKLFALGVTIDRDVAEETLAPFGLEPLEQLGLVREHEGGVRGTIRIIPHDDLWIASDRSDEDTGAEHVAGVHRPSATLADLTVRRRVRRALDVGTGNGIQALLLARHAEHVVGTDVNERALAFAQFNAALNGVENAEFRAGSFFEPVEGESFDLIVANPPYVISPESEFLFRDSGLGGDRVSADVVSTLPRHLSEGGFGSVMVSWIQQGDDLLVRPREWLRDSGCDAWVFHSRTEDPLSTAASWNRDAKGAGNFAERVDRWVSYYEREGIDALAYGGLVLRKRSGKNWLRSAELPSGRLSSAGDHLERLFAAQDFLATNPDLLATRFAFAPEAAVEQELRPGDAEWRTTELTLKLISGLGFRAGLDDMTSRVVQRLAPTRTLGECLDAIAAELGVKPANLRPAGAALVRQLVELGFLEPR
jgi:methylase of polypeptide subunit release factors